MDLTYSEKNLGSKSTIVTEKRKENLCNEGIESNLDSKNQERSTPLNDDALLVFEFLNESKAKPTELVKPIPKINMKNMNINRHLNISHIKIKGNLKISEEILNHNHEEMNKPPHTNLSFSGESSFQNISEATKKELDRIGKFIRDLFYMEKEKSCLYLHLKEMVKNIYDSIIKSQNISLITDLEKKLDTEKGSDDWSQLDCNKEKDIDKSYFSKQLNSLKYDNISMKAVLRSKDTQIQNIEGGLKKFEDELSGIKNLLLKQPTNSHHVERPVTSHKTAIKGAGASDYHPINTEATYKGLPVSRPASTASKLAKGKNTSSTSNLNSFLIKPKKAVNENFQVLAKSRNDAINPFCQSSLTLGGVGSSNISRPESIKKNFKPSVHNMFSMSQLNLSQIHYQKASNNTGKSSSIDFVNGMSQVSKKTKDNLGAINKEKLQLSKLMTSKNIN